MAQERYLIDDNGNYIVQEIHFYLELRVLLKDGQCISCYTNYFTDTHSPLPYAYLRSFHLPSSANAAFPTLLSLAKSPWELGHSASINDLIEKVSIFWHDSQQFRTFCRKLRKVASMDQIKCISLNSHDDSNSENEYYKCYTYYTEYDLTFYDFSHVKSGTADSSLFAPNFSYQSIPGKDFGLAFTSPKYKANRTISREVEYDPEVLKKTLAKMKALQAEYADLKAACRKLENSFPYENIEPELFNRHILFTQEWPLLEHKKKWSTRGIHLFNVLFSDGQKAYWETASDGNTLGLLSYPESTENTEYFVVAPYSFEEPPASDWLLEKRIKSLRSHIETSSALLSRHKETGLPHFVQPETFMRSFRKKERNKDAYLKEQLAAWKKSLDLDHVSSIQFQGATFANIGVRSQWMFNYLGISTYKYYACNGAQILNHLEKENGGTTVSTPTGKTDYIVIGLSATPDMKTFQKALALRNKPFSNVKLIPLDEFLCIVTGKPLPFTEADLSATNAREAAYNAQRAAAAQKAELAKKQAEEKANTHIERQKLAEYEHEQNMRLAQQARQYTHELALQRQRAEADRKRRLEEEARVQKEYDLKQAIKKVPYKPGHEPEEIRIKLNELFEILDKLYPDKVITKLDSKSKAAEKRAFALYTQLGYPDRRSFFKAYGYQVSISKGGRPTTVDPDKVIKELKRRYPRGAYFGSISKLTEENKDLPLKSLTNRAYELFGMSLTLYLKSIGILEK